MASVRSRSKSQSKAKTPKQSKHTSASRSRSPAQRTSDSARSQGKVGSADAWHQKLVIKKDKHKTATYSTGVGIAVLALVVAGMFDNAVYRALMLAYISSMLFLMWALTSYVAEVNKTVGVLTISELCRKTDTVAHKCLLILAVGSGSLLTGFYYALCVHVPDSTALRMNLLASTLLLLTGVFPMASPAADAVDPFPGSSNNKVNVRVYHGKTKPWLPDPVSSVLHTSGIASYVLLSMWADLLIHRYALVVVILSACVAFAMARMLNNFKASVFTEAVVVTLVVISHSVDVFTLTVGTNGLQNVSSSFGSNHEADSGIQNLRLLAASLFGHVNDAANIQWRP